MEGDKHSVLANGPASILLCHYGGYSSTGFFADSNIHL